VRQADFSDMSKSASRDWHGGKSPSAFRTITEVSTELDLPQHVLRFWETKFPQIKPVKRRGGRRYYRPEDIELIKRIRSLLYVDRYTIKGVQRLLREAGGSDPVAARPTPEAAQYNQQQNDAIGATSESLRRELEVTLKELEELRDFLRGRGT
jgi:DNA-binding transcriptional MerR regulator